VDPADVKQRRGRDCRRLFRLLLWSIGEDGLAHGGEGHVEQTGHVVAVGAERTLGAPGGARRVEDSDRIVLIELGEFGFIERSAANELTEVRIAGRTANSDQLQSSGSGGMRNSVDDVLLNLEGAAGPDQRVQPLVVTVNGGKAETGQRNQIHAGPILYDVE
jgi:hypothetical protein